MKDYDWKEKCWKYKVFEHGIRYTFRRIKGNDCETSQPIQMPIGIPFYEVLKRLEKRGEIDWQDRRFQ